MRRLFSQCIAIASFAAGSALAAQEVLPADDQVIQPQIDRRDIKIPQIPSNDLEAGVYAGTYSTDGFDASVVRGVRLGYHVTEDYFFEAVLAQTRVSDQMYRQILPAGIIPQSQNLLRYFNVSVGYNLFPGELFLGESLAYISSVYLIGGVGSTTLMDERHQTVSFGFGIRTMLADWAAVQVDVRDHMFSLDLQGYRRNTQNIELTGGVTFFY